MQRSRIVALSLLLPLVSGCSLLKKKDAAGDDASIDAAPTPSASAAAATPTAANEKSIGRYPDEKPNKKDATINFAVAGVADAAGGGKTFAFLKKGTAVTQIAERGKFSLVTFKDPKDASRDLMGWVSSDVFGPEPKKAPPRSGGCKADEQLVQVMRTDGTGQFEDRCQHVCLQNKDCGAGTVCDGAGLDSNGQGALSFCVKGTAQVAQAKCKAGEHLVLHNSTPACVVPCKTDKDCRAGSICGEDGRDLEDQNSFIKSCEEAERPTPKASTTPTAAPSAAPAGPKPKCVLPSAPPCKAPHSESPKGLCQVPCPTGDCSACDGTCQKGFCVGKGL